MMKTMLKRKNNNDNNNSEENQRRSAWNEQSNGQGGIIESGERRLNNILNMEKSVIDEVSEAEENNLT